MKRTVQLLASITAGCLLFSTADAASSPKPAKRTLTAPMVTPTAGATSVDIEVVGDCDSQNANVDYHVFVSVSYVTPDDDFTPDVDESASGTLNGVAEVKTTIALTRTDTDLDTFCDETAGVASFALADIDAAVDAAVANLISLLPLDTTYSVEIGCQTVSAKAWTTKNSVADSKPTQVAVSGCE